MIGRAADAVFDEQELNDWLQSLPRELPRDAVGMWQIVADLRQFGTLPPDAVAQWAKRGIRALLDAGAVAVTANRKGWLEAPQFGESPTDIADAVITAWLASGQDPPPYDSVWFALPDRVKTDHG